MEPLRTRRATQGHEGVVVYLVETLSFGYVMATSWPSWRPESLGPALERRFVPCARVKWNDMQCAVFRRTAIPTVLAALALTASVACSGRAADRGSAGANPTVATEPPTTTTTNPYAVPAVIDAAYVDRVLVG